MNDNKNYEEYELNNGLLVALERTPTKTVSGQVTVYSGTVNEAENSGVAHFLEHAIITGGAGKYLPEEISNLTGAVNNFGAATYVDETMIGGGFMPGDLETFLDITSSMFFHPRLDAEKIEQERKRILREISDDLAAPGIVEWRKFVKKVLGNHPHTLNILGTRKSVRKITREDLQRFHSERYGASNMELVLVGDLPDNSKSLIEKFFSSKLPGKGRGRFTFPYVDSLDRKVVQRVPAKDLLVKQNPAESNSYINLQVFVPPRTHKDFARLCVLAGILGRGHESYLFKRLSQKAGLAYSIGAKCDGKNNFGRIIVEGKVTSTKSEEAIDEIFDCFKKLREELVDEKLLERRKKLIEFDTGKSFETNEGKGITAK